MAQNHFLMYFVVFAVVFVPYLFLAFFINKPARLFTDLKARNIPPFYRMMWGLISCFTESVGDFAEELQPVRRRKFQNALIVANIKMDTNYIFAAEILSCLIAAVGGTLIFMMLTMNGISVLIMWVGAGSIDAGAMQVGDMLAFIQYTMQIIMAFLMISLMSVMLPRASVSAGRIQEVLDTPESIASPASPKPFDDSLRGTVTFQDVRFRYPGSEEDTLSHISFTALPGQTTAILGGTGCGKSTLINLIPRFYDVTEGQVLVDGCDVRQADLNALRDRIGYVPQKGVLFSGTVESNIGFGSKDIAPERVREAAQIAQAEGFILQREDAYQSDIAQGGANVSGGQKQRLSIARAVAKSPEIYLFDDSFSALDFKTDAQVRSALAQTQRDATVIVVAQRISTVMHAQQILVLDEGRLVGKGTHAELMRDCEIYRQIAMSQLSKEELERGTQA